MEDTGISPAWRILATNFLGVPSGRHCHWCVHAVFGDGEVTCGNAKSPYADGDRIRTWDGEGCAAKCQVFQLSDFYTSDESYNRMKGNK